MKMKLLAVPLIAAPTLLSALVSEKMTLLNNMNVVYNEEPPQVTNVTDFFWKGKFYGRLRSNNFWWLWDEQTDGKTMDNQAYGYGGSVTYKTGYLYGFGATVGFYTTHTFATNNTNPNYNKPIYTISNNQRVLSGQTMPTDFGKAGKDTYSRHYGSDADINSFANIYAEYLYEKNFIRYGRVIFDSVYMSSNDTKMIPNTFQGFYGNVAQLPDTNLRLAYFDKQKLRDHRTFHSVIAYGPYNSTYYENDDAGINKGISVPHIMQAGKQVNPGLITLVGENKSIENLSLYFQYVNVIGYLNTFIPEAKYKIGLSSKWSLTPAVRYVYQLDTGAGGVGGAALSGSLSPYDTGYNPNNMMGYSITNSVDGGLWAAKLELSNGNFKLRGGYSYVLNKADLIAPWRGFPTGGYTRSMAQYNWNADTTSWMLFSYFDFGKAGVIPGFRAGLDYAYMDYSNAKIDAGSLSTTDRSILHLDLWKTFDWFKNFEMKFRAANVWAEASPITGIKQGYHEFRFELNYLF